MLTWQQSEFLLKGVYLGLLVMIAWCEPTWLELGLIALVTVAGLALCLGVAAWRKIREGYHVKGRLLGFVIFLLLENAGMVYAGLLLGLSAGVMITFEQRGVDAIPYDAIYPVLGGGVLGAIFYNLRGIRNPTHRLWANFAMIAILVGGAAAFYFFQKDMLDHELLNRAQQQKIALLLALGIPGFYLLTFSGLVEESEIEIGAMCAAAGVALGTWLSLLSPAGGWMVVLLPLGFYVLYTSRYMPALRVFKHALRGMSYRQMGQTKLALVSLNQALTYDPQNPLARREMWTLHRDLDFTVLKQHPDVVQFLNFDFCLERISQMLQSKPSPEAMQETHKMLALIAAEQPALAPVCAYWTAVACLHERNYDESAKQLVSILQLPQYYTAERDRIHFFAWYLALYGHPEMVRRVGQPLLAQPGQRMDAIAAVETQLALSPQDPNAWDMKRELYAGLTEWEYCTIAQPGQPIPHLNFEYAQQLGMALLDDPNQWKRGCEYLRIAAHGLKDRSANLYIQIGDTHHKHGDNAGLWANYMKAMQIGRAVGVDKLRAEDKEALFGKIKAIGERALKEGQTDAALEAFKFYSLNESAGIETWRSLAILFERKADAEKDNRPVAVESLWQALRSTEHALTYNAQDADLIARKDRYYYSITPEELQSCRESVRKWFDPQYCRDKARWILEKFNGDFELLDWAAHLSALALVAQPGSHAARLLKARVHRLRGEIPEATAMLEEIRQHRPEKFFNDEEQKAWYFAHRMLGDFYLDEKPDESVKCFVEFRQSNEAGADTSYKMGQAFEKLGDFRKAAACYSEVTAFEQHPLYYEARDALDRVKRAAPANR